MDKDTQASLIFLLPVNANMEIEIRKAIYEINKGLNELVEGSLSVEDALDLAEVYGLDIDAYCLNLDASLDNAGLG